MKLANELFTVEPVKRKPGLWWVCCDGRPIATFNSQHGAQKWIDVGGAMKWFLA